MLVGVIPSTVFASSFLPDDDGLRYVDEDGEIQFYEGKYTVVNYVQVLIRDINNAGNIIDNAVANGANGLTSFTYSATENPNSVREARTLAVQNAQDAAALIAGASGCKIADVLDIQEGYNSSSYSRSTNGSAKLLMADSGYSTPIEAGTVSVSSTVTITFSLAN